MSASKACYCALVGSEFGQFVPEQTVDTGILAIASWTSAELFMGEEPDILPTPSYAAFHLHFPGEMYICQEVCRFGPSFSPSLALAQALGSRVRGVMLLHACTESDWWS